MRARRAAALGGAAAAGFATYHAQMPTSQLYGRTLCRVPGAERLVALTYDDGPNPRATETLLDVLDRHGARATFLVIGRWVEREPALVRAIAARGHALGNHTWSHPTMPLRSASRIRAELRRCRDAVEDAGAAFSDVGRDALARPPYGHRRPGTLRALRAAGYLPLLWSITCFDWRRGATVRAIAGRGARARGGDIVLLHDGSDVARDVERSRTIAASEEIIDRLAADGYRFVTVPELVAAGARLDAAPSSAPVASASSK